MSGDREARFETFVAEVYEPLQRYFGRRAHPDEASELLNDTLLVMWRRLDDVPRQDVRPWAFGVAKNCLANERRSARRRIRLVERVGTRTATPGPSDLSAQDSDHPELAVALAELNDEDRELVRLWGWEQLDPREIAIVLDTTANAVSSRLTRLKKKLASSIERQNRAAAGHEEFGHAEEVGS